MFERILEFQANQKPDRPAIWTELGELKYSNFFRDILRYTAAFEGENIPKGIILIDGMKPAFQWLVSLALERLGYTTAYSADKLADIFDIIEPSAVITLNPKVTAKSGVRVLCLTDEWRARAAAQNPSVRRSPVHDDDLIRIVLSSGTTGVPKKIPLTRRIIDERILNSTYVGKPVDLRFLSTMGMDTISGFSRPLSTWYHGGLFISPFAITNEVLKKSQPNLTVISPDRLGHMLPMLSNAFDESRKLNVLVSGSAMPPSLISRCAKAKGLDVFVTYGSTEAAVVAFGPAAHALKRPGAVGHKVPWAEIEVLGADGRRAPVGESGEIRLRTAGMVTGYLNDDVSTERFRDGWFYPNDSGRFDRDGVLIIDGRLDDVINLGGNKLSATRIEETVLYCAGVEDAAVAAMPMASGVWKLFCGIVSTLGYNKKEVEARVAEVHHTEVSIVDLPKIERNGMGKIVRPALRDAIIANERSRGR